MANRCHILLRHGETIWNTEQRFQGHLNSPLTELGRSQEESVGRSLTSVLPSGEQLLFYASPIGRAAETARIVARAIDFPENEIIFTGLLKEYHYGAWSGFTREEIEERYPGEFEKREQDKWNYRCANGESYACLAERAKRWLSDLPSEGVVISVAHGMINRVIRGMLLGLSNEDALAFLPRHDQILKIYKKREVNFNATQID